MALCEIPLSKVCKMFKDNKSKEFKVISKSSLSKWIFSVFMPELQRSMDVVAFDRVCETEGSIIAFDNIIPVYRCILIDNGQCIDAKMHFDFGRKDIFLKLVQKRLQNDDHIAELHVCWKELRDSHETNCDDFSLVHEELLGLIEKHYGDDNNMFWEDDNNMTRALRADIVRNLYYFITEQTLQLIRISRSGKYRPYCMYKDNNKEHTDKKDKLELWQRFLYSNKGNYMRIDQQTIHYLHGRQIHKILQVQAELTDDEISLIFNYLGNKELYSQCKDFEKRLKKMCNYYL
eukprot:189132_1